MLNGFKTEDWWIFGFNLSENESFSLKWHLCIAESVREKKGRRGDQESKTIQVYHFEALITGRIRAWRTASLLSRRYRGVFRQDVMWWRAGTCSVARFLLSFGRATAIDLLGRQVTAWLTTSRYHRKKYIKGGTLSPSSIFIAIKRVEVIQGSR